MASPPARIVPHRFRNLEDHPVDIAIIGGGIVGAGVAREAALRGYSVALFEREDLASGTSSRSSRLIHGGLRYLEHGRLGLVHESVSERWRLLRLAPHLVAPLPFLFPVYRGERPGLGTMRLGTWVYSMLAAFRTPGPRQSYDAPELARTEPQLRTADAVGAAGYFDCATNDARLTLETALDAAAAGAAICPRALVRSVRNDGDGALLEVEDLFAGDRHEIRARVVVVAAGPWTDRVLASARPGMTGWLRPTKGVHLVVPAEKLPIRNAVVMRSVHNDHRITFAIPWLSHTYVGTTDTDFPDPDAPLTVTPADVRYMLDIANHYFPGAALSPDDVTSVWAGLRPLVAPHDEVAEGQANPSDLSREEKLETYDGRFVVVAGGKLTTYRVMAEHVVRAAARLLQAQGVPVRPGGVTADRPLPGAQGLDHVEALATRLVEANSAFDRSWVRYLALRYGVRARLVLDIARSDPALAEPLPGCNRLRLAEVHHHVLNELATSIEDILVRRTYVHYRTADQGSAAAEAVADCLVKLEAASTEQARAMVQSYRDSLKSWRSGW